MNKIVLALLAGVVIGILVAPDKGSATVKKLRSRLKEYKDQVEDAAMDLASEGKEAFQNGRARMSDVLG